MKQNLKIFLSTVLIAYSDIVFSKDPTNTKVNGGLGGFTIGYQQINVNSLNTALKANKFASVNDNVLTFGGGGHAIINNLIIGGEGYGTSRTEGSSSQYQSAIDGGYGQFNVGYIAYSRGSLLLYPMIGIASGVMNVKLGENPTATSMSSILANPRKEIHMRAGGFMLDLKLGIDYILGKKSESNSGVGGFLLGIRVGYNYVPFAWKLKWEGTNVINAPTVDLSGTYIKIVFGGGGFSK